MHFADLERIAHFRKRLSETVAWCDTKEWAAHPGQGLCTPLLRPPEMRDNMQAIIDSLRLLQKNGEQLAVEQVAINRQWQGNGEQLATKRASFLQAREFAFSQPVRFLLGGRLLAFDPQNSLDDGLAGEVTQGFFDDCNIPAWDTWISYVITVSFSPFCFVAIPPLKQRVRSLPGALLLAPMTMPLVSPAS
jgi:hypothetical protein